MEQRLGPGRTIGVKANDVHSGESQSYSASYDLTTRIISAVVCAILLGVAIVTQSAIVAGLGAVLIILSYGYSPRGYSVSGRSIVVKRLIGNVRIPLDGIREIRAATADDLRGCVRLWGNGGLFGYYGLFMTSKLGKSTWYVTSRGKSVVVIAGAKTVVLSPDDVEGFLTTIRASAPAPIVSPGAPLLDSVQYYRAGTSVGKLIGAIIGIAVIAVVGFAMLYSPGPPSYTLTPTSLAIHDRFYAVTLNATEVDVEEIRVVDLTVETNWRPAARTNGFANSHYHSGWFRVGNGQKVRMYWTDSKRLVLLPPRGDGAAVLLETKEPDKFVNEVRKEWSNRS
jgi:hypothetical protein